MMRGNPDQDGRYPLSSKEYAALRAVFGAYNCLDSETLKDRCGLFKNGWRDFQCAKSLMHKLMTNILMTVPRNKLLSIQNELRHTVCRVEFKPASSMGEDMVCIPMKSLLRLLNRAIYLDCQLCDKTVKECKHCDLFKDISITFPYELTDPKDTKCPFAGLSKLEE